jgi:hypothetical protein
MRTGIARRNHKMKRLYALQLGLLLAGLCACAPRADPELTVTIDESRTVNIEARVGSDRARGALMLAIASAAANIGWSGTPHVSVADRRPAAWEMRGGELMTAIAPMRAGRLTVSGRTVELTGTAPASAIAPMTPALENLFGSSYHVRVALAPALEAEDATSGKVAMQAPQAESPEPAVLDPARLTHRWTAEVNNSKHNPEAVLNAPGASVSFSYLQGTPPQLLPSDSRAVIAVDDSVSCSVGPEVHRARESRGRVGDEVIRLVDCPGAELEGGVSALPERNAVACIHPHGDPILAGSTQLASWLVRRNGSVIGQLIITCHAEAAPAQRGG